MKNKLRMDEVRPYLEKGYRLIIQTNPMTNKTSGLLLFMQNAYSVNGMYEVEVNEFMNFFENIKNVLVFQFCCVQYNAERNKVVNSIKLGIDIGENILETVVGNLEVEADDLFMSFFYQEEKIKDYLEEQKINMLKLNKEKHLL